MPPRVHIFLWLISNNKVLTRANLAKRRTLEDLSCLFCSDPETTHHLFFDCCITGVLWKHVYDNFEIQIGSNFESVAHWWVSNNRNSVLNTVGAALLWSLWKLRNEICFQGKRWKDEQVVLNKIVQALKNWRSLCKVGSEDKYNWVINMMLEKSLKPLMLTAGNLESGTFSPSTSDPTLSELGASGAASSTMAESFSFLERSVANSCI